MAAHQPLYQQALKHQAAGNHQLAFAAAKQALDAAPPATAAAARSWLLLASCAAAIGELELAYCLYARGWMQCRTAGSGVDSYCPAHLVEQLSAQRLKVLGDLCQPSIHSTVADKLHQRMMLYAAPAVVHQPGTSSLLVHVRCSSSTDTTNGSSSSSGGGGGLGRPGVCCQPSTSCSGACRVTTASSSCSCAATSQDGPCDPSPAPTAADVPSHRLPRPLVTPDNSAPSSIPYPPVHPTQHACCVQQQQVRRVFCVSDLHVDQAGGANMAWLERISTTRFQQDVLLVAGDVADSAAATCKALQLLKQRFRRLVWVPGNHELWVKPGSAEAAQYPDAFTKLMALRQMALEVGVDLGPVAVGPQLLVVPLLSWYNHLFDAGDPRPGQLRFDRFCSWPVSDLDVWQVMLKLNARSLTWACHHLQSHQQQHQQQQLLPRPQPVLQAALSRLSLAPAAPSQLQPPPALLGSRASPGAATGALDHPPSSQQPPALLVNRSGAGAAADARDHPPPSHPLPSCSSSAPVPHGVSVITMSHFLPHPGLSYSRGVAELGKAVGCSQLLVQLQQVDSQLHVFGHTHINQDVWLADPEAPQHQQQHQQQPALPSASRATIPSPAAAVGASSTLVPPLGGTAGLYRSAAAPDVGLEHRVQRQGRRYVQYALEAAGGSSCDALYCIWDGHALVGHHVPIS